MKRTTNRLLILWLWSIVSFLVFGISLSNGAGTLTGWITFTDGLNFSWQTGVDMFIDPAGDIGIWNTNPGAKLHVSGNVIANNPSAANHLATKSYVDGILTSGMQIWSTVSPNSTTCNPYWGITTLYPVDVTVSNGKIGIAYRWTHGASCFGRVCTRTLTDSMWGCVCSSTDNCGP